MDNPIFRFTMRATPQDTSGYYHPRWDNCENMTIVAETRKHAADKARNMLGKLNSGYEWSFAFDHIDEIYAAFGESENG